MEWILYSYAALSVGMASMSAFDAANEDDLATNWHWYDNIMVFVMSLIMWPWLYWDYIAAPRSIPQIRRDLKAKRIAARKRTLAEKRLAQCEEGWQLAAKNLDAVKQQNREQRQSWQAEFDALEAPHAKARQLRREAEERQAQVRQARAELEKLRTNGPVLFESGAKATFYEHGRQLFNLGAKLILGHLDDTERNALDYYLQSSRRAEGLRRNWDGTQIL
jgi:hypothetical protein